MGSRNTLIFEKLAPRFRPHREEGYEGNGGAVAGVRQSEVARACEKQVLVREEPEQHLSPEHLRDAVAILDRRAEGGIGELNAAL